MYEHTHIHTHACMHRYTCTHACKHTHIHACMHTHTYPLSLERRGTYHDGPGPHFIMATGEEVLQVEGLVASGDDLGQSTAHNNNNKNKQHC